MARTEPGRGIEDAGDACRRKDDERHGRTGDETEKAAEDWFSAQLASVGTSGPMLTSQLLGSFQDIVNKLSQLRIAS